MKIEQITLREIRMRLKAPFETSFGVTQDRRILLVEVLADGITGWGEITAIETPSYNSETTDTAWHIVSDFIAPVISGADLTSAAEVPHALAGIRGHYMPRLLGHYVRDEHLLLLEQAIRKITSLPAQRERLRDRGLLKVGYFADVTVFDPAIIRDKSTYETPSVLSEGVKYVFVNGQLEYDDGHLTGMKAGVILRGPGWKR